MLHEVLLALSGHPSPLFDKSLITEQEGSQLHDLLSPSESALLETLGRLADLHRRLKRHAQWIAFKHRSIVCRACATTIRDTHLARFQRKILDVESKILTKDASTVGAYDIVPLAGVVGEFDEWHRRMSWYWDMACFMQPPSSSTKAPSGGGCTGAAVIDKLRIEQQTGFPDIESAAVELSKVAETAWLRQLASWVLYGKLPAFGADDFFIQSRKAESEEGEQFFKDKDLLPKFVTTSAASSILFIGKSLHQVRQYGRQAIRSHSAISQRISEKDLV